MSSTINTMLSKIMDAAAPKGQLPALPLNCSSMSEPIMKFLAPPKRSGARKAPRLGTKTRMQPAITPGFTAGKTTRRNVAHLVA